MVQANLSRRDSSHSDSELDRNFFIIERGHISEFNPDNTLSQSEEVLTRIRSWLKPTEHNTGGSEYQKHLSCYLEGTGDWIFSATIYQQWKINNDNGILWVRGAPGSGKSVLAANIIQTLVQEGLPVLYFFFRHTVIANHSAEAALRDWIAQALRFSPPLQLKLSKMTDGQDIEMLSLADLFDLIHNVVSDLPKVYIVIDALDEMDQGILKQFLECLKELSNFHPSRVKCVVTSRPTPALKTILREIKVLSVGLDKQNVGPDVLKYVNHRITSSTIPDDNRSLIVKTIADRCDSLFLYAKLAIDIIIDRPYSELDKTLRDIPTSLSTIYSNVLKEQTMRTQISTELQLLILQLVIHASRPLRLLEISEAISVTQGKGDIGETKKAVRDLCGSILDVLPNETVHVVNHSLAEFLDGTGRGSELCAYPISEIGATHNRLAILCISYLASGPLDRVNVQYRSLEWLQMPPPFTRYAAINWHVHVRKAILAGYDQSEINENLHRLLIEKNLTKVALLGEIKILGTCDFTALGLATALRLKKFAQELLDMHDPKESGNNHIKDSALRYAAQNGNAEFAQLFLDYGADPLAYDRYGRSPLHLAVENKQHECAIILLESGVSPFIRNQRNAAPHSSSEELGPNPIDSPAGSAFSYGDMKMFTIFFPYLTTAKMANLALKWATENRKIAQMELILGHPMIEINAVIGSCYPLYTACSLRDPVSIDLLLKAGANPNITIDQVGHQVDTGRNVLYALASGRSHASRQVRVNGTIVKECFKLVLDAGARFDHVDIDGRTPLHCAADAVAASCLIEAGANPNTIDRFGHTLLDTTRDYQIIAILKRVMNPYYLTGSGALAPLVSILAPKGSSFTMQVENALQLLELGGDVEMLDEEGNGPIHHAVRIRRINEDWFLLLRRLHEKGAAINLRNNLGETPLHWALPRSSDRTSLGLDGDLKILMALVAIGGDLEIKNNMDQTPFLQIMNHKYEYNLEDRRKLCNQLAEAGVQIDATDSNGRNILHYALQYAIGDIPFLEFLVSLGINPRQPDNKGNTLWHLAVPYLTKAPIDSNFFSKMKLWGVKAESTNVDGQTSLHVVASFRSCAFLPGYSTINGRSANADEATLLDYFLMFWDTIDCVDKNGITPLHLASTFSEYSTRRLLEQGADINIKTSEGLTSFHLAARSKQPNVLGVLLTWVKSKFDSTTVHRILNEKDDMGRTALYYGCVTGRVEIVQLLLDAGATIETEFYQGSPWDGCANMEIEQTSLIPDSFKRDESHTDVGGILLSDKRLSRRFWRSTSYYQRFPYPEERLEEILELLSHYNSPNTVRYIDQAISFTIEKKLDYTTASFLRYRQNLGISSVYKINEETLMRLSQCRSVQTKHSRRLCPLAENMMDNREYERASKHIEVYINAKYNQKKLPIEILEYLVAGGFSMIIGHAVSSEIVQNLGTGEYRAEVPILIDACRREFSNIDVIRLLVEKKGADVNSYAESLRLIGYKSRGPTALHILIRQNNWWQVYEALPYLLKHGADIEARDEQGITPLGASLEAVNGPNFNKKAVETLLQWGADVNAEDDRGIACLTRAIKQPEIFSLLLKHHAVISPSTILGVINQKDFRLMERILTAGADPNLRQSIKSSWGSSVQQPQSRRPDPYEDQAFYPIDYIVSDSNRDNISSDIPERMLALLLDHGASVSARYEETTIIHRVVQNSGRRNNTYPGENFFLRRLLKHPTLEIEARDAKGMTILLHACRRSYNQNTRGEKDQSLIQVLLELGANIEARDNTGKTALHHLMTSGSIHDQDFDQIIQTAPKLIHAIDDSGMTPLHAAMISGPDQNLFNKLKNAGADLFASVTSTRDTIFHLLLRGAWIIEVDGTVKLCTKPRFAGTTESEKHNAVGQVIDDDFFSLLLSLSYDINTRNKDDETPIFGYFREVKIIVKVPVLDDKENRGHTPYWVKQTAAAEKEYLIWELLEKAGVDWDVLNTKGENLLHIVAADMNQNNSTEMTFNRFKFLLGKGLNPRQENSERRTPLDIAAERKRGDILALYRQA